MFINIYKTFLKNLNFNFSDEEILSHSYCKGKTGTFPHPYNCSMFILCVYDKLLEKNCVPGTCFSHITKICEPKSKVNCEAAIRASDYFIEARRPHFGANSHQFDASRPQFQTPRPQFETPRPYFEASRPQFETSRTKFEATRPQSEASRPQFGSAPHQSINYQLTRRPHQKIKSSQEPKCPEFASGLHPHPGDCSKFLNCANGMSFVQDCAPGTLFNPKSKICDFPHNVKCEISSANALEIEGHGSGAKGVYVDSYGNVLNREDQEFASSMFGQGSTNFGQSGTYFEHKGNNSGQIKINLGSNPVNFGQSGTKFDESKIDFEQNESKFNQNGYTGQNEYSGQKKYSGQTGIYGYNFTINRENVTLSSNNPSTSSQNGNDFNHFNGVVKCPKPSGIFPHPYTCFRYIRCIYGVMNIRKCPDGTYFNPVRNACDYSKKIECDDSGYNKFNDYHITTGQKIGQWMPSSVQNFYHKNYSQNFNPVTTNEDTNFQRFPHKINHPHFEHEHTHGHPHFEQQHPHRHPHQQPSNYPPQQPHQKPHHHLHQQPYHSHQQPHHHHTYHHYQLPGYQFYEIPIPQNPNSNPYKSQVSYQDHISKDLEVGVSTVRGNTKNKASGSSGWPPAFPKTDPNADYIFEYYGEVNEPDYENIIEEDLGKCKVSDFKCGLKDECVKSSLVCDGKSVSN